MSEEVDPMAWLDDPRGYLDAFILENSPPDFVRALYDTDDPYHAGAQEQYKLFLDVAEKRMAQLKEFNAGNIEAEDLS